MASRIPGGEDGDIISEINVTPLVDVVLVLLIIFMVTASYIVKQSIEVDLPKAAHAGEASGSILALVLTRQGEVYLDGARADEQQLRERVRAAVAQDRETRAIISADRMALHGAVVHLIDLVKGAGVSRFALHIEKEE
jgi:biopolymer transport protein ExbD